jgi:hypothetical protein
MIDPLFNHQTFVARMFDLLCCMLRFSTAHIALHGASVTNLGRSAGLTIFVSTTIGTFQALSIVQHTILRYRNPTAARIKTAIMVVVSYGALAWTLADAILGAVEDTPMHCLVVTSAALWLFEARQRRHARRSWRYVPELERISSSALCMAIAAYDRQQVALVAVCAVPSLALPVVGLLSNPHHVDMGMCMLELAWTGHILMLVAVMFGTSYTSRPSAGIIEEVLAKRSDEGMYMHSDSAPSFLQTYVSA